MCARRGRLAVGILATTVLVASAQVPQSPGQGRSFAQWDKIQISVTAKLAPNLYILQGSPDLDTNHPDAAGGRVAVLFGPDGILMVDSQDEELHEKVLKTIRTFSSAPIRILVNSHIHSDHTGGNPFFAKQGALIYSREELRDEMLHPPRQGNGIPGPAPDPDGVPVVTYPLGTTGTPAGSGAGAGVPLLRRGGCSISSRSSSREKIKAPCFAKKGSPPVWSEWMCELTRIRMGAELNVLIVSRTFSCSSSSWESTIRMPSGPKSTATRPPAASGWFVSRLGEPGRM